MANSRPPIIGILARRVSVPNKTTKLVGVYQSYIDSIVEAGLHPLVIPSDTYHPMYLEILDGLFLPGGDDLSNKHWYDKVGNNSEVSRNTGEETEATFVRTYIETGKPVLGVCRGMQFLNCVYGGSLKPADYFHTGFNTQKILTVGDTIVESLYGAELKGKCNHKYTLSRIATNFHVSSLGHGDGVESIEHRDKSVLGIQWHPEIHLQRDNNIDPCFTWLAEKCK